MTASITVIKGRECPDAEAELMGVLLFTTCRLRGVCPVLIGVYLN